MGHCPHVIASITPEFEGGEPHIRATEFALRRERSEPTVPFGRLTGQYPSELFFERLPFTVAKPMSGLRASCAALKANLGHFGRDRGSDAEKFTLRPKTG
jgi:hypothetical protein